MEDKKQKLYSKYTDEQLSRLLITCLTNESGEIGPSTKSIKDELERREKSKSKK